MAWPKREKKKPLDFEAIQAAGEKATTLRMLQRQNDIITLLLEGKEKKEITTFIVNKYKVSVPSAAVYISEAVGTIKARKNYEIQNLISLHIYRYEYIYKKLYEIGAHHYANAALKAKEKLLGFHRQGFHMKVTQGEIQQIQQKSFLDEYDESKWDEQQKNQIEMFLDKMKTKQIIRSIRDIRNDLRTD